MAPVYKQLKGDNSFEPIIISTGQHREMLVQTMHAFQIAPDVSLDLMVPGLDLSSITSRILTACGEQFRRIKPNAVLVQGDTISVIGAALAAFYEKIPIGHVEAGLRTYNLTAPWPEEMIRRLVDPISNWCFVPTKECANNLASEKIEKTKIYLTGNTVIDSLNFIRQKIASWSLEDLNFSNSINEHFNKKFFQQNGHTKLILVTGHRRESFGAGFEKICNALRTLADTYPDVGIIYPVHLNPAVQEPVKRILGNHERIQLTPPISYPEFVWLMERSYIILTDSGGVQEEAPSLGKPVLVMRDTTERSEGIVAGTSRLTGTNQQTILAECAKLLTNKEEYKKRSELVNPFGDGNAAKRIVTILKENLG